MEELQRLAVLSRKMTKPTLAAASMGCRLGVGEPPQASTWLYSSCLQTRDVVNTAGAAATPGAGSAVAVVRPPQPQPPQAGAWSRALDEFVRANVWVDGAMDKGEVRRYIARHARIVEGDVAVGSPVWATPGVGGGWCTQVTMRRPCLRGLATINATEFEEGLRGGVRVGDLAPAASPLAMAAPATQGRAEESAGGASDDAHVTACARHPRDIEGAVESSIVLYNIQASPDAIAARLDTLRGYGFVNYHAVHPLLAAMVRARGDVDMMAAALYQFGVEHAGTLVDIDAKLYELGLAAAGGVGKDAQEARGDLSRRKRDGDSLFADAPLVQSSDEQLLSFVRDLSARTPPIHTCALSQHASRLVLAVLSGLDSADCLAASRVEGILPVVRAAMLWNRAASDRVRLGLDVRKGDLVYDATAGGVRRVASAEDAAAFTPLDWVLPDTMAASGYRAVIAVPYAMDHHIEASPHLRLVSDPERQAWSASPPTWYVAGADGLHMMKAKADGHPTEAPAEGPRDARLAAPSLALRMRLPATAHILAATFAAFDVCIAPQTAYDLMMVKYNRLV